jgi:hypothetical protein
LNELARIAVELGEFCSLRRWPFCVIGGFAVQHWGEPRMTMDIDLTLLTGFGSEEEFVDVFLQNYAARRPDTRSFALQNRVLLLRHPSGVGIDIALGALPFEESAVHRAVMIEVEPQANIRLCTAEDLIVMKAFADRPIDWKDVRGIIVRQGDGALDWGYVRQHLQPLCEAKEQPEIMVRLEALRREVVDRGSRSGGGTDEGHGDE